MTKPTQRKLVAEATGTMFLVAAVIGSGIAASRLSPHDTGLQLLENAIATGAALTALILALQPVSAAFNPVITVIEAGEGTLRWGHAASAVGAQIAGGVAGAVIANLMFGLPAISIATTARTGPGIWLAEVVAAAGLVMVIGGPADPAVRTGRRSPLGVHPGRLLVHQLDKFRQPGGHHCPHALRLVRRHRAQLSAHVPARAGRRRSGRLLSQPNPLPQAPTRRCRFAER